MSNQITHRLLMIRPAHFGFNHETADNNVFQQQNSDLTTAEVSAKALQEFDILVEKLRANDVIVDVIEDTPDPVKPDAIFPNNWISLHSDGALITYPMFSSARREERRQDIIDRLSDQYQIKKRYAFEQFEEKNSFLEGTGSMVLDRENKIVYACLSDRTDIQLLDKFCVLRGFEKVVFNAISKNVAIYHTNVIMALGERFVVICMDCIPDNEERKVLLQSFSSSGKEVIEISVEQLEQFAGNMLQVESIYGDPIIVMSQQAYNTLHDDQTKKLEKHGKILSSPLDIIEGSGGGSARCMMAENFLAEQPSK